MFIVQHADFVVLLIQYVHENVDILERADQLGSIFHINLDLLYMRRKLRDV